jgi:uncharacterized protein YrrD
VSELISAALGRPVVARDDAETIGEVKAFVFDDRLQRVKSLQVAGSTRRPDLVDWDDIVGFGPDAVVIASEDALRSARDEREVNAVRHRADALGSRVLDERGDAHGTVVDIRFDPGTGAVAALLGEQAEWPVDAVRGFGSFAVVIGRRP